MANLHNAEQVLEQERKHESAKALVKLSMTADEIRKQVIEEEYRFARENPDYIRDYISEYFKNETENSMLDFYLENIFNWEDFENGTH
jgi:hypothetical protein